MKNILVIIVFTLLVFIEISFVPLLGIPCNFFMPTPLFLIVLVTRGWKKELWFMATGAGLVFDSFSPYLPATFTIIFFGLIFFTRFIFYRWFTNRSPLSLLMISIISLAVFYGALMSFYLIQQLMLQNFSSPLSILDILKIAGIGIGVNIGILFVWLIIESNLSKFFGNYLLDIRRHRYLR